MTIEYILSKGPGEPQRARAKWLRRFFRRYSPHIRCIMYAFSSYFTTLKLSRLLRPTVLCDQWKFHLTFLVEFELHPSKSVPLRTKQKEGSSIESRLKSRLATHTPLKSYQPNATLTLIAFSKSRNSSLLPEISQNTIP